ncbi:tetratricopeptide repeat protein [Amphritea sp. 1_MG-2023]|uniref:L,D-transpeptidase Cds6 family protein n=1 Tax=Amphritea sp. 1_MG-2023 TaxID=3062670 RepID=UPI0026E4920A|nr:tetratricopeptide repeat protein [Amphritea sp. 1_MG-2023]MDO6564423.1 tetratricopeptide repeat protein [Amphritea sp. 1_MG-2023]
MTKNGIKTIRSATTQKLTLALAIGLLTGSVSVSAADQKDSFCQSAGAKNGYDCQKSQTFQASQLDIEAKLKELNRWMADEEKVQNASPIKKNLPESDKLRQKIEFNAELLASELKHAKTLQDKGDLKGAFDQVNDYLVSNPKDPNGWLLYGISLINQNKLKEAADIFSKLSHLYPDAPEPYNNLAVVYARQGDNDQAVEVLLEAFETHPSYAQVQTNLKAVYSALATQAYNRALDLDNKQPARADLGILDQVYQPLSAQTLVAAAPQSTPQAAPQTVAVATTSVTSQPSVTVTTPSELIIEERDKSQGTVPATITTEPAIVSAKQPITPNREVKPESHSNVVAGLSEPVRAEIQQIISNWASSWSAQDVSAYLNFYTDSYTPDATNITHRQWVWGRQQRLSKPSFIKVVITDVSLAEAGEDKIRAVFRQRYQSNTYQDDVYKTLTLTQQNGAWKIQTETTL